MGVVETPLVYFQPQRDWVGCGDLAGSAKDPIVGASPEPEYMMLEDVITEGGTIDIRGVVDDARCVLLAMN